MNLLNRGASQPTVTRGIRIRYDRRASAGVIRARERRVGGSCATGGGVKLARQSARVAQSLAEKHEPGRHRHPTAARAL